MKKNNIVYVIGAGASVATGIPAMNSFVATMYEMFADSEDPDYQNVFRALSDLRKVYSNSQLDLSNIESVLAAFDMGRLVKRLGRFQGDETKSIYRALVDMIVQTVEQNTRYDGELSNVTVEGWYNRLVTDSLQSAEGSGAGCDFITLNYDVALDFALSRVQPIHYGHTEEIHKHMLLKLHGSINWSEEGDKIVVHGVTIDDILKAHQKDVLNYHANTSGRNRVSRILHTKRTDHSNTFIVPPSYSKHFQHQEMQAVWQHAARLLRTSDTIVFIGYSVPPSDLMVRYLFAVGTLENDRIKRVICLNPDESVKQVYRQFLGQHTNTDSIWKFITGRFDPDGLAAVFSSLRGM